MLIRCIQRRNPHEATGRVAQGLDIAVGMLGYGHRTLPFERGNHHVGDVIQRFEAIHREARTCEEHAEIAFAPPLQHIARQNASTTVSVGE